MILGIPLLSVTGLVRTILILIGVVVVLRFLGQLMQAKRNMAAQEQFKQQQAMQNKQKQYVTKNEGKTSVIPKDLHGKTGRVVDVDFEEVKE